MTIYEYLKIQIKYAKMSISARDNLYAAKGMIDMAFKLNAITLDEYLELDHECVAEGINNPKYF